MLKEYNNLIENVKLLPIAEEQKEILWHSFEKCLAATKIEYFEKGVMDITQRIIAGIEQLTR